MPRARMSRRRRRAFPQRILQSFRYKICVIPHGSHACESSAALRRRRGTARFKERTVTGTIRTLRVDKGFGFIKDDKGQDYFFHQSAISGEGIGDLREGDSVEFEVGQGPKGPRAENVRRTST